MHEGVACHVCSATKVVPAASATAALCLLPPCHVVTSCSHLVVTNPHIQRVYMGYFHAFETLRGYRSVQSLADNTEFCSLLRRLVDEHGACRHWECVGTCIRVCVWGGGDWCWMQEQSGWVLEGVRVQKPGGGGAARRAWQTTQSSAHCCEHRDVLCGGECCAARSALHPCPFSASSPFTTFTVCQPQSALSHVFTMHLIQNVSPSSSPFPVSSAQPRYLMSWRLVWLSVEPSGWWDQHCSWTTFWTQCCEGGSPHTHAHETISWLSVGLGRLGSSRYSVSHTYALYICLHVKTRR